MIEFHAWQVAWESAMAERGYPRARLSPFPGDGPHRLSYVWTTDIDADLSGVRRHHLHHGDAWRAAHETFLAVDLLRPPVVEASVALTRMLDSAPM